MFSNTRIKFDQESRIVYISLSGQSETDGVRRHIEQAIDNPEFRAGMDIIVDLREVEFSGINYRDFLPFSTEWKQLDQRLKPCRIGYIRRNNLEFMLGRFLVDSFIRGGVEKRSFIDLPSAAEWIRFPRDSWHMFSDIRSAAPAKN